MKSEIRNILSKSYERKEEIDEGKSESRCNRSRASGSIPRKITSSDSSRRTSLAFMILTKRNQKLSRTNLMSEHLNPSTR